MLKTNFLLAGVFLLSLSAAAQPIAGRVVDATNLEPLAGSVILAGGQTVIADTKGQFQLEPDAYPTELVLSHVGYATVRVVIEEPVQGLSIPLEVATAELNEVVVTSTRSNTPLKDTPASVGIVTRQMLSRDDQTLIAPSLNRIPGVHMQSGTLSTNRISIRGIGARIPFGTNKIRAYYDQIPLTNGVGETALEDIDLSLIERVEVIKGPNSSLYGAGLGGVITLKPTHSEYDQTSVSTGYMAGSYRTMRWVNTFRHSNEGANLAVVHSLMNSDGYRENNEFRRESISTIGHFMTGKTGHLSLIATYIDLKAHIPSSINKTFYDSIPQAAAPNWNATKGFERYDKAFMGVSYRSDVLANLEQATSVFLSFYDTYEPRPRPLNILKENTLGAGFRSMLRYRHDSSSTPWSASMGIEYFRDRYKQQLYENLYDAIPEPVLGAPAGDLTENRSYYNLFIHTDGALSSVLGWTAGLNLNETRYRLTDFYTPDSTDISGSQRFSPILSPRMGIVYHQNKSTHLYATISHGFSPPTLEETLNPEGALNPEIKPEIGWNMETGARGSFISEKITYDFSVYQLLIRDLLVARRTAEDVYVGINAGKTRHFGIELALTYQQELTENYQLNYFLNGSIQRFEFATFVDGDNTYSGNQLTGAPSETINAGIDLFSVRGVYAHLNAEYISRIPLNDANSAYADDYVLTRGKLGYKLQAGIFILDIYAGVNNLMDVKYASMLQINAAAFGGALPRYYYPGLPRNYFGGGSLKLLL